VVKGSGGQVDTRVVEGTAEQVEYYVLAYDTATMDVRSFTGHGHDFVGAVMELTSRVNEFGGEPNVAVRLYEAESFSQLPDRYPDPFKDLRFPS
jgi:hypothetical protein